MKAKIEIEIGVTKQGQLTLKVDDNPLEHFFYVSSLLARIMASIGNEIYYLERMAFQKQDNYCQDLVENEEEEEDD